MESATLLFPPEPFDVEPPWVVRVVVDELSMPGLLWYAATRRRLVGLNDRALRGLRWWWRLKPVAKALARRDDGSGAVVVVVVVDRRCTNAIEGALYDVAVVVDDPRSSPIVAPSPAATTADEIALVSPPSAFLSPGVDPAVE